MNKRKTMFLTVAAVALFRVMVAVGGGILTDSRENISETENNLTSETSQPLIRQWQLGMDYPYFEYGDLRDNTDNPAYTTYKNLARIYTGSPINSPNKAGLEIIAPGDDMISYQQAANIGGEISKKLCYFMTPENYKPMITLFGNNNGAFYDYCLGDGDKNVRIFIKATTGQVFKITPSAYFNIPADNSIQSSLNIDVSQDVQTGLIKMVNIDSYNMFYGCTPEVLECSGEAVMGYYQYSVTAKLSDGKNYTYRYITTDNDTFQLHDFRVA